MPWVRASLRGQIVFAEVRDGGAYAEERGRVEIRFKGGAPGEDPPAGPKKYSALVANLEPAPAGAADPPRAPRSRPSSASESDGEAKPKAPRAPAKPRAPRAPKPGTPSDEAAFDGDLTQQKGRILVYTDGACTGNPGPAGLGVVVVGETEHEELSEYLGHGTNNIAELTAIQRGVELCAGREGKPVIHTDSQYSIGVLSKGWKAKANQELIALIKKVIAARGGIELRYVKGHAGVPLNERCDELARRAVTSRSTTRRTVEKKSKAIGLPLEETS